MICVSGTEKIDNHDPNVNVEFANGTTATSIDTTNVSVSGKISVKAAVFTADYLTSDLISVSQIVNENKCDVLFPREKVSAIDRSTKSETIIGRKNTSEKLWEITEDNQRSGDRVAHLAISITSNADFVKFTLECFGNPPAVNQGVSEGMPIDVPTTDI